MTQHRAKPTEHVPVENQTPRLIREDVDDSSQSIEEAAYYIGMNRERYGYPGDHLNDWYEAEKAVRDNLD